MTVTSVTGQIISRDLIGSAMVPTERVATDGTVTLTAAHPASKSAQLVLPTSHSQQEPRTDSALGIGGAPGSLLALSFGWLDPGCCVAQKGGVSQKDSGGKDADAILGGGGTGRKMEMTWHQLRPISTPSQFLL